MCAYSGLCGREVGVRRKAEGDASDEFNQQNEKTDSNIDKSAPGKARALGMGSVNP